MLFTIDLDGWLPGLDLAHCLFLPARRDVGGISVAKSSGSLIIKWTRKFLSSQNPPLLRRWPNSDMIFGFAKAGLFGTWRELRDNDP